jgi:2-polyprenyl-3-methyl-5-hydroxy-6-metoxy-1,4-benzoquinol methylase
MATLKSNFDNVSLPSDKRPLELEPSSCCICGVLQEDAPCAVGEDFEYRCSPDTFLAKQCYGCGLVYLDPRPTLQELDRLYGPEYHAFQCSRESFGTIYKIRKRLEAKRLSALYRNLPANARILDIGCGDGFHLKILREFGPPGWILEGVDASQQAVDSAARAGLTVHHSQVETMRLPDASYDLILLIATLEHISDPRDLFNKIFLLLRPGGRVLVITDNTETGDFALFKGRYWGGYHFPRHWNLFNRRSLEALAHQAGLGIVSSKTQMSPVNWVYSIHNMLQDMEAPQWLVNRFTLHAPVSLAFFTVLNFFESLVGKGALLRAVLERPATQSGEV